MSHEIVIRGGHLVDGLGGEAIDHGAIGFSSNRYKQHKIPDGRAVPGTLADLDELVQIIRYTGIPTEVGQA